MYNPSWLPEGLFDHDLEEFECEEIPPTLRTNVISELEKPTEYKCIRCKDWFKDVEPNQDDGSFKCYLCRHYNYR